MWLPLLMMLVPLAAAGTPDVETSPIKVGFLLSYTGITPLQAKGVNDGAELAFDESGNKAGGREVRVLKEDTEFNPTVALTKVRKLVEEQKVHFIIGPIGSAEAVAIHDYISKQPVILIVPCAFTKEVTSPARASPNIFRTVETTDQGNYPMGQWLYNKGHRNVILAAQDYRAGHDSVGAFRAAFEKAGGKIVKEVYTPLGTMDFAPFMAAMDVKGADATYVFYGGTDAVRFVQQYHEFGLKRRFPLYGYTAIADDPYLPSMGDAAIGVISSTAYTPSLENKANQAFVRDYQKKYGELPSHYAEYGYVAGKMIVAVTEALKGRIEDVGATAKEMIKVASKIEAPSGPLNFDRYNQRIVNVYVQRAEKRDGKLVNVVIGKLGQVGQEDVWGWWRKQDSP